jgi:hypothetical protein
MNDRKASATAGRYLARLTGAESPAHEQSNGLAQGLVRVPGDGDRLRMQVVRDVECGTHIVILTPMHHDAMVYPYAGNAVPGQFHRGLEADAGIGAGHQGGAALLAWHVGGSPPSEHDGSPITRPTPSILAPPERDVA